MTISRRDRMMAENVAAQSISEGLTEANLRSIASALGCQDPAVVVACMSQRSLETRMAELLVEEVIEAMQDAKIAA